MAPTKHTGIQAQTIPLIFAIISSAVAAVIGALVMGLILWLVCRRKSKIRKLEEAAIAYSSPAPSLKDSIRRVEYQPSLPQMQYIPSDVREPGVRKSLASHAPTGHNRRMSRAELIGYDPRPAPMPNQPPPPLPTSFPSRYPGPIVPPSGPDPSTSSRDFPRPPVATSGSVAPLAPRPIHPRNRIQSVRNTLYSPTGTPNQSPAPPLPKIVTQITDIRQEYRSPYAADSYVSLSPGPVRD
ncbi:hypothetical protein FRB96_004816 [Tulasnella sp. 330]|nr:hypothetical protein FRB96_004816 [Tulasnella sp. 330]KAG8872647.1 hypothetical protein FRB97_007472 [Tulasnella sp. 331]KAG8876108.1 hypothetical protein FRB98_007461 [Tulasnella sp. 332]